MTAPQPQVPTNYRWQRIGLIVGILAVPLWFIWIPFVRKPWNTGALRTFSVVWLGLVLLTHTDVPAEKRNWIGIGTVYFDRRNSETVPSQPSRTEASVTTPSAESEPRPRERAAAFRDGMNIVGTDIQPGTYRAVGPFNSCYWARLSGLSGNSDDIIANDNGSGPVVKIGASDKAFQSRGCGTWTADLSPITQSPDSSFGNGTFIVGTDISAGTWKSDSPESCYWARLSGFSGGMGHVIANENGAGLVQIARTDKGFLSSSCGTWTKIAAPRTAGPSPEQSVRTTPRSMESPRDRCARIAGATNYMRFEQLARQEALLNRQIEIFAACMNGG